MRLSWVCINEDSVVAQAKLSSQARQQFRDAKELIKQRDVDAARVKLLDIEHGSSLMLFHRMMAICAFIEKDFGLASAHIEQAIGLEPEKQSLIADAIRIYKSINDDRRANELFRAFNIDKADSSSELLRMAMAMKSLGHYDDAIPVLAKALRLSPENVRVRNLYGLILTHLERNQDAMQQWSFSLRYNPHDVQAMVCLGRMHLHRNENLKAIEYFKQSLLVGSEKSGARTLNLAEAYLRVSSINESRELLSSIEGFDTNPRLHYLWGVLHSQVGDYFLAFSSLNRCIQLGREQNNPVMKELNWPDDFTSDEEIRDVLMDVRPRLDSLFDALSILKSSEQDNELQEDNDSSFSSDVV